MKTYYEIMGVTRSFTANELKEKWRELSRRHHPDKGGTDEAFAEVTRAHSVLRDPKARKLYDAAQDLFTDLCTRCNGEGQTYKQRGFTGRVATPCEQCNGNGRTARSDNLTRRKR